MADDPSRPSDPASPPVTRSRLISDFGEPNDSEDEEAEEAAARAEDAVDYPQHAWALSNRLRRLDASIQQLALFVLWIGVCATASVGLAVYALFFRR